MGTNSLTLFARPISNFYYFRLELSGAVGAVVGFFCGIAIVWSPLAVVYFYSTWDPPRHQIP